MLFALGTTAAFFVQVDFSPVFTTSFVFFATLCSLNCIGIALWERDLDRVQRKDSIATRSSDICFCYRPITWALALVAFAIALWAKAPVQFMVGIGVSTILLGILDWLGDRIPRDERTALADLVLLTPLLFLLTSV